MTNLHFKAANGGSVVRIPRRRCYFTLMYLYILKMALSLGGALSLSFEQNDTV